MSQKKPEFKDAPSSYWITSVPKPDYPQLNEDISVDVAIIGGGIVGISTAYLLINEGLSVAIIEADQILHGTTGHTTAKITSQHNLIYARLKKEFGEELARQYADANENAIKIIDSIVREKNIDCDFMQRPAFVYTQSDQYIKQIEEEVEAAASLGIKAAYLDEIPLPFAIKAAVRFDNQAQFHPLKYLQTLAKDITDQGGQIFEQTQAIDIEENEQCTVITRDGKKVNADKVIIASHFPFFDGGGLYFTRIYIDKSYVIGAKIKEKFPEGMFINAEDPARSLRSQNGKDGELILVGGEHHKTGHGENTNVHYQNLINFANDTFQVQDIPYRWSTQDCMTLDGIPYVGNLTSRSPHIYVATGFGKWGMTNSTAAATIIKDLITKGDNPWAQIYNPSRSKTLNTVKSFIVQNVNVAKDLVSGKLEKISSQADSIKKGQAQLIDLEGEKTGVYRDDDGTLHMVDTTCTHLGCEVKWNAAETSWDCPCHGSRFSYKGDIIEGPALNPLKHPEEGENVVEAKVFK